MKMLIFGYYFFFSIFIWGLEAAAIRENINDEKPHNIFSNNSSLIPLGTFGEKSYYLGANFKATFLEAEQFCRLIHMKLVRIKTDEEIDKLYEYVQDKTKEEYFWTAGSKLVDKRNWIWLTTGEVVEYTKWKNGEPNHPDKELCLDLVRVKNKGLYFNDAKCGENLAFICETDENQTQEPYDSKDTQWSSVFQNSYVSPNINLLHFGGKSYYFGTNFKATYLEATQFCRIINMQLVSINSQAENDRLHKYIRDMSVGLEFWSSASKAVDGNTWVWLSTGETVQYFNWKPKQPQKKNQFCIYFQQTDNGLFWHDYYCHEKLHFICEKYNDPLVEPRISSETSATTENTVTSRRVDRAIHYPENSLLPNATHEREYKIIKVKVTQEKASQICKDFGMQLLSISNQNETNTIKELLHGSGTPTYWTSAKKYKNGDWRWEDQQHLNYTNWAPCENNNLLGKESCHSLSSNGFWNGVSCDVKLFFICQSPIAENVPSTSFPCSSVNSSSNTSASFLKPIVNIYINNNQVSYSNPEASIQPRSLLETSESSNVTNKRVDRSAKLPLSDAKEYKVVRTNVTQGEASQICKEFNMQLVSISNAEEKNIITEVVHGGGTVLYWSSGMKNNKGKWLWGNQQPITYFNWAPKEPNNLNKKELCLHFYASGLWNDIPCGGEFHFVCQGPVKEKGTTGFSCSSPSGNSFISVPSIYLQPVVNIYIKNNGSLGVKNETVAKFENIEEKGGYNVVINNNFETLPEWYIPDPN